MVPSGEAVLAQLRRGALEYCVLAMVEHDELYGFEIARRLTNDGVLLAGEGTLYPLLARLRKAGLVRTTWQESTEGPPRRYYTASEAGREAVAAFRPAWKQFRDAVDDVLAPRGGLG